MSVPSDWPEPIIRVQSISDAGMDRIPERYVKAPEARALSGSVSAEANIPIIDLLGGAHDQIDTATMLRNVSEACQNWGFFQVVNHGVSHELMDRAQQVWRDFFHQPMEVKQPYANSPKTYEGYGSRLGVEKGAILDWSDYYFLHYLPCSLRDLNKWPVLPTSLRAVIAEYSEQVVRLGGVLLKILSMNLGLKEDWLKNAFGGDDIGACLRVNYYPKCPQPDLTLGLSPHSDPGGMTILLPDQHVPGLQVRRDDGWITIKPVPHAFIVNIGDQIQPLSNGKVEKTID
ncbi:leucoanthocyanidin dioxygenase [Dorcoceras hygrometricum]|uniref:Leucoanthocyanidin dioxygenase n=1 Tax=Dorcoceras hygrometricum TaxID=472368 RepID=A0A2Z7DBG4_9LAMI|nr:leucoanthocyanidin dioxygenase [Dorcoceras hygrometricum]